MYFCARCLSGSFTLENSRFSCDCRVEEEYLRRLREEEEAGFTPQPGAPPPGLSQHYSPLDGSLGSDHRSSSSGARDDPYRHQQLQQQDPYRLQWNQPPYAQQQPYQSQQQPYPYRNGLVPRNTFEPPRGGFDEPSPRQSRAGAGDAWSNRNLRPPYLVPDDHSRQSSDSVFDNQLNKAQENIDFDQADASFEKTPFFTPKHQQTEKQGMNLRPLSDLYLNDDVDSKGRDENFNMKPAQYNTQNLGPRWENSPHSRYSYNPPSQGPNAQCNNSYGAHEVDFDAYTGGDPRLYKGYSENLAQPLSQWHDLKTPQERQEKLRSDRYGTLPGSEQGEGPVGSSSTRAQRRALAYPADPRPGDPTSLEPRQLQREESLRRLYEWQQRVSTGDRPPSGDRLPTGDRPQSQHNPIYENLNTSYEGAAPGRPPLPATYRDRIVQVREKSRVAVSALFVIVSLWLDK